MLRLFTWVGWTAYDMTEHTQLIELARFATQPHPCPYLPDESASLTYRVLISISSLDYESMLQRGWRRFGCEFFRPSCAVCTECRSLRVPLATFVPSRSQRRALAGNSDIEVVVDAARVTPDHVQLYNDYHADMHVKKDWPLQSHTLQSYYQSFVIGDWPFAHELRYYERGKLVGVALADITPHAMSCIYFYHDPAWRSRSPGVFSVMQQIAYARELGLPYVYLGYWVAGSRSMAYKAQYRPHELLVGYPNDDEVPVWTPPHAVSCG